LTGVTPAGTALLDHHLELPQAWAQDQHRRDQVLVPAALQFRTEPQRAVALLRRTQAAGVVRCDWVVADATVGRHGEFLDALDALPQR
jgi:SRSO17 transposase